MHSVLYVDDESTLLEITKLFLEETKEFSLVTKTSAQEALVLLKDHSFDAIISDYQMPEMDGIAFLKAVRERLGDIPFILFTGRGREEVVIDAINNGADFYLQKGGDPEAQFAELAHKIRQSVARKQAERSLMDSERRLSDIIDFLPDATFAIDRSGKVIAWNRAIEEMTGIPNSEMLGKGNYAYAIPFYGSRRPILIDMINEPDEKILQFYSHIYRVGNTLTAETDLPVPKGNRISVLATVSLLYNQNGDIIGAIESIRDITERKRAEEELVLLKTSVDHAYDEVFWLGFEGNILYVNEAACTATGYSREELLSMSIFDLDTNYPPDVWVRSVNDLRESKTHYILTKHRRKNGTVIDVEIMSSYVRKGDNEYSFAFVRDVSDRKHTEDALRESEENFRKIFENSAFGITLVRPDLQFMLVNPAWISMLGYTQEEFRKMSFADITHPDDLQENIENIRALAAGTIPVYSTEKRYIQKDGSILWGAVKVTTVRNPDGTLRYFLAQIDDITPRKRAEEIIRENDEKLALVMNGVPTLISYMDLDLRFVYVNKAHKEWYGLEEKDLKGKSLSELLPEDVFLRALPYYQKALCGQEVIFENPTRDKEGRKRVLMVHLVPHFRQRRVIGFFAALDDITERKNTEFAFQAMVRSMVGTTGQNALRSITENVSSWLGAECVMVGEIQPDRLNVKVLSMLREGKEIQDISCIIKGTPCENVIEKGFCVYPDNITRLFPESRFLARHNIRGFVGTPLRNSSGNVIGVLSAFLRNRVELSHSMQEIVDIIAVKAAAEIERSQMESVLFENQQMLADAMDLANLARWEYDVRTEMFTFDDRFYALYGTTAELEGGHQMPAEVYAREFVHPEDRGVVAGEVEKAKKTMDPRYISQLEHRIIRRDGQVRYVEVRIGITKDSDGQTIRTHGVNQDITERILAETALRESESKFRRLADNAPDMIYRMSLPDGRYEYVSPASVTLTGYTPEEFYLNPKLIRHLIHPVWRDYFSKKWEDLLEKKVPPVYEYQIIDQEGKTRWFNQRNVLVADEHGQPVAIEAIVTDTTPQKETERELRKSEQRFLAVSENIGTWIWEVDPDGLYRYCSPAVERILGYPPEELVGKLHYYDLFEPSVKEELKAVTVAAFGSHEPFREFINPNRHKNGRDVLLSTSGTPVFDENGVFTGYIGTDEDITKRHTAEIALRESEAKHKQIFDSFIDIYIETDKDGIVRVISPSVYTVMGWKPEELIGNPILVLYVNPADLQALIQRLERDSAVSGFETMLKKRDGSTVPVSVNARVRYTIPGGPDGIVGSIRDITESVRAQKSLQASEIKYRHILENMQDAYFQADMDGILTMVSPSAARIYGYGSPGEMIGIPAGSLYTSAEQREEMLRQLKKNGKMNDFIGEALRKDGTTFWASLNAQFIADEEGRLIGTEVIVRDITERKSMEQALREANRKLNLLSSITRHDVINQLTVLRGYTKIAAMKKPDPVISDLLVKIDETSQTISRQIEFTKTYQNLGMHTPDWFRLEDAIQKAARPEVKFSDTCKHVEIFADPMLERVFFNLFDNAIRHGERVTEIIVRCERAPDGFIVIIEDNGVGIPPPEKNRIFEKGYGKHTGFGLFLAKEILAITGITISETGIHRKGARFEILVPKGSFRFAGIT
jgi:PAS domain S-box-containing protein